MSRNVRRHFTFANICSFLALVIALSMGSAYAADKVRSKDIVDGQVKTADLGRNAVSSAKVENGSIKGLDILTGAIAGAQIADGGSPVPTSPPTAWARASWPTTRSTARASPTRP